MITNMLLFLSSTYMIYEKIFGPHTAPIHRSVPRRTPTRTARLIPLLTGRHHHQPVDMAQIAHLPAESPLPPAILRSLGDRSYDKRKNAALEIEALIKALQENNDTDRISSVICMLGNDFSTSTNPNHRKGGLIGLAATSIGTHPEKRGGERSGGG